MVTRKRAKATPDPEAPITGVAAGSLGTAANLDDTQVLRTEDLGAAAPDWLDDDSPVAGDESAVPPEELALLQTAEFAPADARGDRATARSVAAAEPAASSAPLAATASPPPVAAPSTPAASQLPRDARRPRPAAATAGAPIWRNRSTPALAGVAALFVLLLIAGSGLLSQLDLGIGTGGEPVATANPLIEAAPSPTPEPKEQKAGKGKCHGHGHGDNCQGGED